MLGECALKDQHGGELRQHFRTLSVFLMKSRFLSLETVRNKTVRFTTLFESVQNSPKQKLSLYNTIPTLDCANKPLKTQSEHNVPDMLYWCVLSGQIVVICYCFVFRTLCLVPRKVFSVLVPVCSLVCGKNKQEM